MLSNIFMFSTVCFDVEYHSVTWTVLVSVARGLSVMNSDVAALLTTILVAGCSCVVCCLTHSCVFVTVKGS